jgi:D-beta-D-heptose 7-phosphate kinase/D-beta-D-heptose 1-phosphate adenosyltransferase
VRGQGRSIVFTNGCFDVLHRGHIACLSHASQLGDVLVVAVNSDASVSRIKGPGRPVNAASDRAAVLAAVRFVDYVTIFDEESPLAVLELVRPDVYVKGGDYDSRTLPETAVVERYGGQVRILGYLPGRSTTAIVRRIRSGRRP